MAIECEKLDKILKQAPQTQPRTSNSPLSNIRPSTSSSINITKENSSPKLCKLPVGRVIDLPQESSCDEADESMNDDEYPSPTQPEASILNSIKRKVNAAQSNLQNTSPAKRTLTYGISVRASIFLNFSVFSHQ